MYSLALREVVEIRLRGSFSVRTFEVGLKRAVLGLPFYAAWNLAAYINEQQGLGAKLKAAVAAVPCLAIATAIWAAPWLVAGWVWFTLKE